MTNEGNSQTSLRTYVALMWRRRAALLPPIIVIPLLALGFSLHEPKRYAATAQVLLSRQNLANDLSGETDATALSTDFTQIAQSQAQLATTPAVAAKVISATGVRGLTPRTLLEETKVSPNATSDFLDFQVTDANPSVAKQLVVAFAKQYIKYSQYVATQSIDTAASEVSQRLADLGSGAQADLRNSLIERLVQLQTLAALQTSNAFLAATPTSTSQTQPNTKVNVGFGLLVGLIVGGALAFLSNAFDTRLVESSDIAAILEVPLLARVPSPDRELGGRQGLVIRDAPASLGAEAIRLLRMALEFATDNPGQSRVIGCTSAVELEGKSTTTANVALAMAISGKTVALVDLDLHRPTVAKLFDVSSLPGLTQVVIGDIALSDSLKAVSLTSGPSDHNDNHGVLGLLTSGPLPPRPSDVISGESLRRIIDSLKNRFDVVLIDLPPVLLVSDAVAAAGLLDALFVVTRLGVVRRPMVAELGRVLRSSPVNVVGFVVTGAELEADGPYGGSYYGGPYRGLEPQDAAATADSASQRRHKFVGRSRPRSPSRGRGGPDDDGYP